MSINLKKYDFLEGLENDVEFIFEGLKIGILEEIVYNMKVKNISRADLARKLGTSRPYITRMLRANVNFTLKSLVQIARALNIRLNVNFHTPEIQKTWSDKFVDDKETQIEPINYDILAANFLTTGGINESRSDTA
jgi:transcriptional regulator with XRE-family HTH domain